MTALEKARKDSPDLPSYRIVHYGCPDVYGVGVILNPKRCPKVLERRVKGACVDCWGQEVKEAG